MADGASFDRKCRVVRRLFTHLEGPERESLGGVRLPADPTRVVIVAISVGDAHPRDRRGDRSPSRRSSRSKNSHRSSRSGRASADSGMSEMAADSARRSRPGTLNAETQREVDEARREDRESERRAQEAERRFYEMSLQSAWRLSGRTWQP
ncbi:hypothetical protein F441_11699 [Phytophthora nicotianae CJ01A1]|uniref:Uncharacterized protein n=2 Tax=Phytophthora nicotianae TaxID=4792 RepID=W2Q0P9_PHYN3|nr:hypothetical protein PPTG_23300 [Phytophthora nicotianae INRA-310]ETN06461.1 hypothetical protein PPTG_23300 [Phytophthora nicotianae INRA-310]ETP13029.1 hypothetical protein F441_11699 [Phytophthora nicotianae CJ01A1]